jgi:hypothetical protein
MSDAVNFSIGRFNPRTIPDSPVIVAIAKRRSGKSFLVRDLLYHMRKRFIGGIVMSATEEANGFYQGIGIPPAYIYNDFDEAALERLVESQKRQTKAGRVRPVFVVLDDVAFNKSIFNRPVIRELALNGRHYRITVIFSLQYALDTPPSIRSNIDLVMLLRDNINRDKLYKNFFHGLLPNFAFFNTLMDAATKDYKCLILDNASHSTKLSDILKWYRAKDRGKFKIGSKNYYEFNKRKLKRDDERPKSSSDKSSKYKSVKLVK